MSIFVHSNCQIVGDTAVNHLAWSNVNSLCALSTYTIDENDKETNRVVIVNSEGEIVPSTSEIESEYEASHFNWHPRDKFLAVGWSDGTIMIIVADVKIKPSIIFSSSSQHSAPVTLLRWNPSGKRLVSGDKKGLIIVWSCDSRGNLSMIRQYRKKGEITCLAYCPFVPKLADIPAKGKIDPKIANFSPPFFVGTDKGAIIYADDVGHCTDVNQLSSAIDVMLFFQEKSRLVIITRSLLLTQYFLSEEGKLTRAMQVKLSVSSDIIEKGIKSATWTIPGIIVASTEERVVRFFDLATDENYNISLTNALGGFIDRSDRISVVAFSPADRYLAVGTFAGIVAMWKFSGPLRDIWNNCTPTSAQDWELIYRLSLGSAIMQLQWWYGRGCLAVVTEDDSIILSETAMNYGVCSGMAIIQRTINEVLILNGPGNDLKSINTGLQVRGLSVAPTCFLVWSGKVAKVYRLDSSNHKFEGIDQIKTAGTSMVIADSSTIIEEAIFSAEGNVVKIMNFTGTQKGLISFSETEGNPLLLDLHGKFLAVATSKGFIKVFDVHTPTKPKQLGGSGVFSDTKSTDKNSQSFDSLNMKSLKINASGTMIAILCDRVSAVQNLFYPDARLFVFDRNKGSITNFDFASLKRYPVKVFWDESDDRLMICESMKYRETENLPKKTEDLNSEQADSNPTQSTSVVDSTEVFTFFVTSEHGILMQDSASEDTADCTLIGLSAPNIYYKKNLPIGGAFDDSNLFDLMFTRRMRDFVGIERITDGIKSSLLDFSFFLTLGKLDEAYRVVKEIDSPLIWENMAQMCVKTKRLDVAEVCLGNMGHARGAAAVRDSKKQNSLEVSIGVLAIQLGLLDDAAKMFREANRYDLLNQLYQAAGLWDKAIEVAESKDRIHLKATHYQFAKYLENLSKIDEAIEHFQISDTARTEVPRLLFHLGRIEELNEYVMKSDDSSLLKWWASYLESIDRLDKAKKYYNKAKDYLSLVRIYCFQGDFQKAVDIITESSDRASAYHFARQMENQGEYQEAIRFYALSGCYNHSIRLAKAYNLDSELMRFAVKSTQALMIECAQHFEAKSEFDKAIQLYHKGGDIPRALELCFRIGEDPKHPHAAVAFDLLNTIAQDLGVESSPQTLARCADFLVQHQQYNKAIELYVMAKRYLAAIEMCNMHRVSLTEGMVEALTPPEDVDSTERKEILKSLAKTLKKQGAYTLASKKYTQAGDRVRAIKCLVRGGDTKAIVQFANISRNNEIYTLAANYLQQMNWRENVEIMKAIITFYNKAKAYVQLAGFYDGCAQVEIDEYRDYEKALGALTEAVKCLSKDTSRTGSDMLKSTEKRILIIEKFIEAKFAKNNPNLTVTICEALLQDPLVEEAIRLGDCLALLIETFYQKGNYPEAYHYLQELQERFTAVNTYVDDKLIWDLQQRMGVKPVERNEPKQNKTNSSVQGESKGSAEDEVEEEIDEDLEDAYEAKTQHSERRRW